MTGSRMLLVVLIAAVCMASAGVGAADDANVTFEGHFSGTTDAVAVSGDYAYVADGGVINPDPRYSWNIRVMNVDGSGKIKDGKSILTFEEVSINEMVNKSISSSAESAV